MEVQVYHNTKPHILIIRREDYRLLMTGYTFSDNLITGQPKAVIIYVLRNKVGQLKWLGVSGCEKCRSLLRGRPLPPHIINIKCKQHAPSSATHLQLRLQRISRLRVGRIQEAEAALHKLAAKKVDVQMTLVEITETGGHGREMEMASTYRECFTGQPSDVLSFPLSHPRVHQYLPYRVRDVSFLVYAYIYLWSRTTVLGADGFE